MSVKGGPALGNKAEPEIVVIPDKFYGLALKLKDLTEAERQAPPPPPKPTSPPKPKPVVTPANHAPRHAIWPLVLTIVIFLAFVGGGFVYFNRELLFNKPIAVPTPPPAPKTVPAPPSNLAGQAAGVSSVALSWMDPSGEETGFRIDRVEEPGTFVPLTNLPANSTAFLDVSVSGGKNYRYRVIALGEGGESLPSNEVMVVTPPAAVPAPTPPTLPPGGLDSDSDGLSDLEEPLYGTDPFHPDADSDGFLDGNEVYHLYNPAAVAPVKLLDSGLVILFTGPAGWSVYVPAKWSAKLDVPDGSVATIDTAHGEKFRIKIEDNAQHLPLMDWYLAKNPGTVSTSVRTIKTKGGLEGLIGADRLDAYFAWDGKVFVLTYDIGGQPFVNYRTTYEMMLNSLTLVGAPLLAAPSMAALGGPGDLLGATSTAAATGTVPLALPAATSTAAATTTTP